MPPVEIEITHDRTHETPSDKGFIKVRRLELRTTYVDGTKSEPYRYDVVDRDALDAVVMVLYSPRPEAPRDPHVCIRSALRPPVALRAGRALPVSDARASAMVDELPAGLIEPGETGEQAVMATAARETEEEVGIRIAADAFVRLGAAVYLSPGLVGEKVHLVRAEVDHTQPTKQTGTEVVEKASEVTWRRLSEALAQADRGEIEDCKTELGLRRLAAWLASH